MAAAAVSSPGAHGAWGGGWVAAACSGVGSLCSSLDVCGLGGRWPGFVCGVWLCGCYPQQGRMEAVELKNPASLCVCMCVTASCLLFMCVPSAEASHGQPGSAFRLCAEECCIACYFALRRGLLCAPSWCTQPRHVCNAWGRMFATHVGHTCCSSVSRSMHNSTRCVVFSGSLCWGLWQGHGLP